MKEQAEHFIDMQKAYTSIYSSQLKLSNILYKSLDNALHL